jgi:hypothetical protein
MTKLRLHISKNEMNVIIIHTIVLLAMNSSIKVGNNQKIFKVGLEFHDRRKVPLLELPILIKVTMY